MAINQEPLRTPVGTSWPVRWWHLFPFTFITWLVMQMDKINISFLYVNPAFARQFGLVNHPQDIGLLTSAFLIPYGLFGMLWGPLMERYGGRTVGYITLALWGVLMATHAMVGSFTALLILRVMLGAAEAMGVPLVAWFSGKWLPFSERGRAMGAWVTGLSLGSVITPVITVWLVNAYGWQASFYVLAVLPLIPMVLLFWLLPNSPAQLKSLPPEELAAIEAGKLTNVIDELGLPTKKVNQFMETMTNYRVWLVILMDIGATVIFFGLNAYGPTYLVKALHFPVVNMGLVISGSALVGACTAVILGVWSDRLQRRGWLGVGLFTVGGLLLVVTLLTKNPMLGGIAYGLSASTGTSSLVLIWGLPHAMAERHTIGSTVGTASGFGIGIAGVFLIWMAALAKGPTLVPAFEWILGFFALGILASGILGAQRY